MGKGSSAPPPPDPYKTASAEAQFNRLDTFGPSGSGLRHGFTDPETGEFQMGVAPEGAQSAQKYLESPQESAIRQLWEPASVDLAGRLVEDNIKGMPDAPRIRDRGDVAQNIFDRTFSLMAPGIDKANERLLTNLQARGLPIGGEAFNDAYGEQLQQTQDTVSRLALDSDIAAGSEQSRLFGLESAQRQGALSEIVAAMGGGYNPPGNAPSGQAAGVNYSGLVGQQYQAQMQQYQMEQQQSMQAASTIGGLGAAMIMKSDRRLKRDIVELGQRGPLTLYRYRYLWDRPGTKRVGYMAQEVLALFPQAVLRMADGFMALRYDLLPAIDLSGE